MLTSIGDRVLLYSYSPVVAVVGKKTLPLPQEPGTKGWKQAARALAEMRSKPIIGQYGSPDGRKQPSLWTVHGIPCVVVSEQFVAHGIECVQVQPKGFQPFTAPIYCIEVISDECVGIDQKECK